MRPRQQRYIRFICIGLSLGLATTIVNTASAETNHPPPIEGPKASAELRQTILALDQQLFDIVFGSCDLDTLDQLIDEDFEFIHDKWGETKGGKAGFMEGVKGQCERVAAGTDLRARRVLDETTAQVFPVNEFGAIQTGIHRFYQIVDDGDDLYREKGQLNHLWRNRDGHWTLTRVLSYDHNTQP